MKYLFLFSFFFLNPFLLVESYATVWEEPQEQYWSPDSSCFLLIEPGKFLSRREIKKRNKREGLTTSEKIPKISKVPCTATLYRLTSHDTVLIWKQPLLNLIAPQEVLVFNNGRYIVTFDEWASPGIGNEVMVLYDGKGAPLKSYTLRDISPVDLSCYAFSMAWIRWREDAMISGPTTITLDFIDKEGQIYGRQYNCETQKFDF